MQMDGSHIEKNTRYYKQSCSVLEPVEEEEVREEDEDRRIHELETRPEKE
jgi:hypothetical protein